MLTDVLIFFFKNYVQFFFTYQTNSGMVQLFENPFLIQSFSGVQFSQNFLRVISICNATVPYCWFCFFVVYNKHKLHGKVQRILLAKISRGSTLLSSFYLLGFCTIIRQKLSRKGAYHPVRYYGYF